MFGRIFPNFLKRPILTKLNSSIQNRIDSEYILSRLYVTGEAEEASQTGVEYSDPSQAIFCGEDGGLPVPPLGTLTMRYGRNIEQYLESGKTSALMLKSILDKYGFIFNEKSFMMDWGCTTGRVLRHFAEEAQTSEIWGADIHQPSINWAKASLSPPFHFFVSSSFPYLPFPDNKFSAIYGLSVMTHLVSFRDMWLMELKRILKPDGLLILTIHDEQTIKYLKENLNNPLTSAYKYILRKVDFDHLLNHEVTVIKGAKWSGCYIFFKTDYIRREWGRYLEILEIQPYAEGIQSAVVMKK